MNFCIFFLLLFSHKYSGTFNWFNRFSDFSDNFLAPSLQVVTYVEDILNQRETVEMERTPINVEVNLSLLKLQFGNLTPTSEERLFMLRLRDVLWTEAGRENLDKKVAFSRNILKVLIDSGRFSANFQIIYLFKRLEQNNEVKSQVARELINKTIDILQQNNKLSNTLKTIPPLIYS